MQNHPRRENGITTRYLAQALLNPFSNDGMIELSCAIKKSKTNIRCSFENLNHYFFFHLEQYGAEIDLILWNNDVIIPVEVKAFTDANSPDVKREIIRNCLYIDNIKKGENSFNFNESQMVFPLLIYSKPYQEWKHGCSFNYFNEKFLTTKGINQEKQLDNWSKGKYPIPEKYTNSETFLTKLNEFNSRITFMSWDEIYNILMKINSDGSLTTTLKEMLELQDSIQPKNNEQPIRLISR